MWGQFPHHLPTLCKPRPTILLSQNVPTASAATDNDFGTFFMKVRWCHLKLSHVPRHHATPFIKKQRKTLLCQPDIYSSSSRRLVSLAKKKRRKKSLKIITSLFTHFMWQATSVRMKWMSLSHNGSCKTETTRCSWLLWHPDLNNSTTFYTWLHTLSLLANWMKDHYHCIKDFLRLITPKIFRMSGEGRWVLHELKMS